MLNYETFKKIVKENFTDYMPVEFRETVDIITYKKNNVVLDGLGIKGDNIFPVICINDIYDRYQKCGNFDEAMKNASELMMSAYKRVPVIKNSIYEEPEKKVIFQLINTENNKAILDEIPHREFLNLSIIYRLVIDNTDELQSSKITYELAEKLKLDEDSLFKCSVENTKKIFPPTIKSMTEFFKQTYQKVGMPVELAELMMEEIPPLWVISNEKRLFGAASMLYKDVLQELSNRFQSDLYILPSSVHEALAIPVENNTSDIENIENIEKLEAMVTEVNQAEVAIDERLSNQIFRYNRKSQELILVTKRKLI